MGWLRVVERVIRSPRAGVRRGGRLLGRAAVTRPWLLVVPLLFGVGGAFLLMRLGEPSFRATAEASLPAPWLGPRPVPLPGAPARPELEAEKNRARSPEVLARVARVAGVPGVTASWLRDASTVRLSPHADVLAFSVRSRTAATAVQLANVYAAEFRNYQLQQTRRILGEALRSVQGKVAALRAEIVALRAKRPTITRSEFGALPAERRVKLKVLLQNLEQLSVNKKLVRRWPLTKSSAATTTSLRTHELQNSIIGGLLGALLGIAVLLGILRRFPALRPPARSPFEPRSSAQRGRFWIRQACISEQSDRR
jgi:hypothetical protein